MIPNFCHIWWFVKNGGQWRRCGTLKKYLIKYDKKIGKKWWNTPCSIFLKPIFRPILCTQESNFGSPLCHSTYITFLYYIGGLRRDFSGKFRALPFIMSTMLYGCLAENFWCYHVYEVVEFQTYIFFFKKWFLIKINILPFLCRAFTEK